jgi:hypothetical protein
MGIYQPKTTPQCSLDECYSELERCMTGYFDLVAETKIIAMRHWLPLRWSGFYSYNAGS